MKKTFYFVFILLVFVISGCASFGVWGGTNRLNEKEFIVSVSIPPISGGGTFANAQRTALGIAKKNVKNWGYRYFVLVDGSTSESRQFFTQARVDRRGGTVTNQTTTLTNTNGQFHYYILSKEELEVAREYGIPIIDANF